MFHVFGGGRNCESSPCTMSVGFFSLGFISFSLSNGDKLGSTFKCERCGSGLEEKDEEELGPWSVEHGSFGYLVDYVEGKKSSYF